MKKIYKNPEIQVVMFKAQQTLLAGSLPKGTYTGGGVGARELDFTVDGEY